jgi:hypothetical protein
VNRSAPSSFRPLGVPRSPRRTFLAPAAVRLAQVCLVFRVAVVAGLLLTAGLTAPVTSLRLPASHTVLLPGGALWTALAVWVLAGSLLETVLVLRLGTLRTGSRRLILIAESAVIVGTGMYAAAGVKMAVVPLIASIAAVVLLRLDHVRHSFNRARAERRLVGHRIPSSLYSGYGFAETAVPAPHQQVGYRLGIDCPGGDEDDLGMSTA